MALLLNSRMVAALTRPASHLPAETQPRGNTRLAMPSPWAQGSLTPFPWQEDVFGQAARGVSRDEAMTIPGVSRGRGIILSLIADKPMLDYGTDGVRSENQPAWLYRAPGALGPWQRMVRSLDDHIHNGETLWGCTRGAVTSGLRPIIDAWHIPYEHWYIDDFDRIMVLNEDGQYEVADDSQVIYIPSAHEGLLKHAARTLRGSADLENTWIERAKNPIPALDLHETQDTGMTREERQVLVNDWAQARHDINGAIASTPFNVEARALGVAVPELFIEGRNMSRLDIAAFLQIPGSLLDASTATASLTYVTREGEQSSLSTTTVPFWARPFEDRFSQDDISPRGHSVRFAWAEAFLEPPGPILLGQNVSEGLLQDPAAAHAVIDTVTADRMGAMPAAQAGGTP